MEDPTTQPSESQPETEEQHISSQVCDVCLKDNLLQKVGIIYCGRCKSPFCLHFASKIDVQYCVSCFSEMTLTREDVRKIIERYDVETDTIKKYSRKARRVLLEGEAWLFAQRQIKELDEAEQDMVIEYHRQLLQLLLNEREERKVKKMHRFKSVKIGVSSVTSNTTTTTTTKKTSKTSSTTTQAKVSAIVGALLAKGKTMDEIAKLLGITS